MLCVLMNMDRTPPWQDKKTDIKMAPKFPKAFFIILFCKSSVVFNNSFDKPTGPYVIARNKMSVN